MTITTRRRLRAVLCIQRWYRRFANTLNLRFEPLPRKHCFRLVSADKKKIFRFCPVVLAEYFRLNLNFTNPYNRDPLSYGDLQRLNALLNVVAPHQYANFSVQKRALDAYSAHTVAVDECVSQISLAHTWLCNMDAASLVKEIQDKLDCPNPPPHVQNMPVFHEYRETPPAGRKKMITDAVYDVLGRMWVEQLVRGVQKYISLEGPFAAVHICLVILSQISHATATQCTRDDRKKRLLSECSGHLSSVLTHITHP